MNPKADMGIEATADKFEAAELARELGAYEQSKSEGFKGSLDDFRVYVEQTSMVPGPSNDDLPF